MKKFLKDKERDQLITQHRQEKDGRTRDRTQVLTKYPLVAKSGILDI